MQNNSNNLKRLRKIRLDKYSSFLDCVICEQLAVRGYECKNCSVFYCKACFKNNIQDRQFCVNRCDFNQITSLPKSVQKHINNMSARCVNYHICNTRLPLSDLEEHQKNCGDTPCKYYKFCGNLIYEKDLFNSRRQCSDCIDKQMTDASLDDITQALLYRESYFFKIDPPIKPEQIFWSPFLKSQKLFTNMRYLSAKQTNKSGWYTALCGTPFSYGRHFWQISQLQPCNKIIVGVATTKYLDYGRPFIENGNGFGVLNTGYLVDGLHNPLPFAEAFGNQKKNVIGLYVDMNRGIMTFSLWDRFFGVAFLDSELKNGNLLYPAISICVEEDEIPKGIFKIRSNAIPKDFKLM